MLTVGPFNVELKAPATMCLAAVSCGLLFACLLLPGTLQQEKIRLSLAVFPISFSPWPQGVYRLFTYAFVHEDLSHLVQNYTTILLLGPQVEERYGSAAMAIVYLVTAVLIGIANWLMVDTGLIGSSGISMAVLLLSLSVTSTGRHATTKVWRICPSHLAIIGLNFLQIGAAVVTDDDGTSSFAHLAGALCGIAWLFVLPTRSFDWLQRVRASKVE